MKKEIISIIVLSYNSEVTILETLDSIINQDYGSEHIELIIGDDASNDSTQQIIRNWLTSNKNNFHDVIVNIHKKNKGVVANFNSICRLATSKWIKPIAADDILMKNCISEFNKFIEINNNDEINCVFCKVQEFSPDKMLDIFPKNDYFFRKSPLEQLKSLLVQNFIPAPGSFIKKDLLTNQNLPNEKLSLEDYPLWLKLTNNGVQLRLLDKVLVYYRISESLSNSNARLINIKLNNDVYECKKIYLSRLNYNLLIKLIYRFEIFTSRICDLISIHIFKNKKNIFSKKLTIKLRLFSPIYFITKIKYHIYSNRK